MYTARSFMSTLSILANVMPIGFGRCGDRVLKMPTRSFSIGGEIFAYTCDSKSRKAWSMVKKQFWR